VLLMPSLINLRMWRFDPYLLPKQGGETVTDAKLTGGAAFLALRASAHPPDLGRGLDTFAAVLQPGSDVAPVAAENSAASR
jgi:hypothetical protein